ncbi:hypothetical protein ACQPZJ_49230 [Actinoplanes sp. CA-054009]
MGKRRYVAKGVPGGYQVWDNKARRWWGEPYELYPEKLLNELNGAHNNDKITALTREYRARKR